MLEIIEDAMAALGINYAFMEWKDDLVYPYFTGEYSEFEPTTEDGLKESTFMLTGWNRGQHSLLEQARTEIEEYFNPNTGHVVTTDNSAVAIFYSNAFPVQTGDAELKKIQINLSVKEWKGR